MEKIKSYIHRLRDAFSYRFIVLLFIVQAFVKGICFVVATKGMLPLFKSLGVDAITLQVLGALSMCPWVLKPFFGVIGDLVAIDGYHKRYWMLLSIAVGIFGGVWMVVEIHVPIALSMFLLCINFEIAICDLFTEARYASMMRENPQTGSDIVTLATAFQNFGYLCSMAFVGPLADEGLFRVSSGVMLALLVTPIVPVLLGWLKEERRPGNPPWVLLDTAKLKRDWRVILLVSLTGISAPAMGIITAFSYKWLGLICSIIMITLACIGGFVFMPHPLIGRVALYQVLAQASRISFSSALDYFFTADAACLPGGPAFSYKFYIMLVGVVGAAAALLTSFIYQGIFSTWNYRNVLLFTTILSGVGGIFDFIIVRRWNLLIGIPDAVFFLIGDDILESVVDNLYWIPSSSIISKVCPKGMESSVYAYLAGVANFGRMISLIAGAMLLEWVGLRTISTPERFMLILLTSIRPVNGDKTVARVLRVMLFTTREAIECNWVGLDWLILFGHIGFMLAVSVPASFLIPKVQQDADLLASHSSPRSSSEEVTSSLGSDDL